MKRIKFEIQLLNLTPDALRRRSTWFVELMRLLAVPLQWFHDLIYDKAEDYDFFIAHNNLRKRVEDYLRAKLGNDLITIVNQEVSLPFTVFQKSEGVSVRLYQKSELKGVTVTQLSEPINDISFIVYSNGSDTNKIKALVEELKLIGTKYKIE